MGSIDAGDGAHSPEVRGQHDPFNVHTPPAYDGWIAAQVSEARGTLLHDDQDFERIKEVRPLKTLRA